MSETPEVVPGEIRSGDADDEPDAPAAVTEGSREFGDYEIDTSPQPARDEIAVPEPPPGPDPADRISPEADAHSPDLEALLRAVTTEGLTAEYTAAIGEMTSMHWTWFQGWTGQGFTEKQALELLKVIVGSQFS